MGECGYERIIHFTEIFPTNLCVYIYINDLESGLFVQFVTPKEWGCLVEYNVDVQGATLSKNGG